MIKTSKKSKKVLSTEDIALEAISMTQQGYSYAEVAKSLNVGISKVYNSVYSYRRKTSVPKRPYNKSSKRNVSKSSLTESTSTSNKGSFASMIKSFVMSPINYITSMFSSK